MILHAEIFLFPIEILLQTIINEYLNKSYCLTLVTETPFDIVIPISFTYIIPYETGNLTNQILEVSEMGCSDYIVKMREPKKFMVSFDEVNHLGNTRRSDRKVIFLPYDENQIGLQNLLDILKMKPTKFLANLLLVLPISRNISGCILYDLVSHRFVGPDEKSAQPLYIDRWNSCTRKFENNSNLFPHDMTNLYGKTLKVAGFTYKPYVLLDLDPTVEPRGRDGTETRIIEEFCRWLNCTIELVRDDEHQWGEIYENNTGVGVIGSLIEDRADVGITAMYSWYDEYVVLDFSTPYIRTAVTCVAPSPRILASWEMPLLPFTLYMWLALLFTLIYASIALTIAQGCSSDRVLLTTFGMMITQTQYSAGSTWRIRSITGWLLISGLVLDNAYGGGLASVFTVPKYEPSVDTVQDLVDRQLEWGATHDAWIFSISHSQEPLVKQLISLFRVKPAAELRQKSLTRNIALSIERLPAGYFAVGDYITKEAMLDLTVMQEDFYYEQCVAMLRKSSPYTKKLNQLVGRLHESGLMIAWETQVSLKYLNFEVQLEVRLSRSKRDIEIVEQLSLRHVVGVFIIYVTGVILSILICIMEILVKRKQTIQE
ncbi:glutamate receptor ionotropic, delta-2 isoform X1 [Galleria mellonella]|uniref:Glutamate receptor ionotropic, delta-2 isoform X1 n=1 Tax=Galleria mellonella TaxID=7137 RepID=A0A6J1WD61_GALME|nr:glutamate receptor ionotropic, delta-2 isoform X1 [Galleria mellonella]